MRLFHISDDPSIEIFTPRPVNKTAWPELEGTYVWAISDEMAHNYYLPRFCPRVCRMPGNNSSEDEKNYFKLKNNCKSVIFLEETWKNEIENTILYRYEFSTGNFRLIDYCAGYYISAKREVPEGIEKLVNLPEIFASLNVSLVWTKDLEKYRLENVESGFRYSNIRMAYMNSKTE